MSKGRAQAVFNSLFVGGLVAIHCYLFFEDGVLAAEKNLSESDSLPADDTETDTSPDSDKETGE